MPSELNHITAAAEYLRHSAMHILTGIHNTDTPDDVAFCTIQAVELLEISTNIALIYTKTNTERVELICHIREYLITMQANKGSFPGRILVIRNLVCATQCLEAWYPYNKIA